MFVGFDEGYIILKEGVIVNINCSLLIDQAIDEMLNPLNITWFKDNTSVSDNKTIPNVEISTDRRFCRINTTASTGGQLGNGGCYICQVCDNRTNQICSRSNDTCIAVCGE